MSVIRGVDGV